MWTPVPALACHYLATVELMSMGVGLRGSRDAAEGSRLSPTAERQLRSPCVAAAGPGSCQPWGEPGWPQAAPDPASRGGNESL